MFGLLRTVNWFQFFPSLTEHGRRIGDEANRLVLKFDENAAVDEALKLSATTSETFYWDVAERIETDNWLVSLEF